MQASGEDTMNGQFCEIIQSALRYEQGQRAIIIVMLITTLVVLGLISIKEWKKASKSSRVCICLIALVFFAVGCVFPIHNNRYQEAIMADVHQESFITYHGEFIHDDYQKDSFYHNVTLVDNDGEKILLRLPDYANMYDTYVHYTELPIGSFTGTVIYSEYSKLVVFWEIDNNHD
jgi:hypothetical protein